MGVVDDDAQEAGPRQGYLLLADISGYTAFLTGTELEHAHAIIRELTRLISERLVPPMRFVKLEGDAVFCHADERVFERGERFVELIESCYFDFANRLDDMARETTCPCAACAAIPGLDLKFIAHFGSYLVESEDGREDLEGPDVILAHRLLKNSIWEQEGPEAYAFFTEPCQERLPHAFALVQHSEAYDSFGEVSGGVHDLGPVLRQMREARREYVAAGEGDCETEIELRFPPSVLWQYFVDADKRMRWQPLQTDVENQPNEGGRMGVGASSHCAHGQAADALREYIDWRPFRYFTNRFTPLGNGPPMMPRSIETIEFAPGADGRTTIHWRIKLEDRSEAALRHFENVAAFLRANVDELWRDRLAAALEADGIRPSAHIHGHS